MNHFDANPDASDYPDKLRDARKNLQLSQTGFAAAVGYSGVMQGRYETARSKSNSATPSEKTAKLIKEMIEAAWKKRSAGVSGSVQASDNVDAFTQAGKSLKAVTSYQLEQAIASALSTLIGAPCEVSVKNILWEEGERRETAISMVVSRGP